MKIALASDLHLEFGPIVLENTENADVLILSGDICVATKFGPDADALFQGASKAFPYVLYVMGNHEHYNGDYATSKSRLKAVLERYPNIYLLDKEAIIINGVTFYGGTLWTDFNIGKGPGDETAMRMIGGLMNDYRKVANSNEVVYYNVPIYKTDENDHYVIDEKGQMILIRNEKHTRAATFSPKDAYTDHQQFISGLQDTLKATDNDIVVIGHHAPSKQSSHPRYKEETVMNAAYSSDLTALMLDNPRIKVWTHGHTHDPYDYMVGTTRVVCNPRGYIGYEQRADDFELKFFDL